MGIKAAGVAANERSALASSSSVSPVGVGDGQDADGLAFLPHMPGFFGRQSRFWRQPMLVEEVNLTAVLPI